MSLRSLLWILLSIAEAQESCDGGRCPETPGHFPDSEEAEAQQVLLLQVDQSKQRISQPRYVRAYIQRHSQAVANVADCDEMPWPDTGLTGDGVNAHVVPAHDFITSRGQKPTLSFASALIRAQQTATLTFNQTVYIADFIPENGWSAAPECVNAFESGHWTYLECCAEGPKMQRKNMMMGIHSAGGCPAAVATPESVPLLNYSLLDGMELYEDLHGPNWKNFTRWVWQVSEVKQLVEDVLRGHDRLISVTTHSEFMLTMMPTGWVKPEFASIYEVQLPLEFDEKGEVVGFEAVSPQGWTCIFNCPAGCCGSD